MILCLDTNVVLGMFGKSAPFAALARGTLAGAFRWAISGEILLEYEEVALREMGLRATGRMFQFLELAGEARDAILKVSPSFRFNLVTHDPDDDKFVDCAIAAEADFILTSDRHFDVLKGSGYKPQPLAPEEFIRVYLAGKQFPDV